MNKNVGFPAGLVALLAVAYHLSSPNASELRPVGKASKSDQASAKKKEGGGEDAPLEGPWLATRSFFHSEAQAKAPVDFSKAEDIVACSGDKNCVSDLRKYFGVTGAEHGDNFKFLIATVPDPVHTRLAVYTDASIQSLQKAAETADWEFATQWLPWYSVLDGDEKDLGERRKDKLDIRDQEKQPGLLIFRHVPTPVSSPSPKFDSQVLFVFVVGETPTAGINGYEFRNARAYMKALAKRDTPIVRIDGPSFSGSFQSLAELIKDDRQRHQGEYAVRSGTAVSDKNVAAFRAAIGDKSSFFAANESLQDQKSHFCAVLGDLHISRAEAAFLVEDETGLSHGFNEPLICFDKDPPIRVLHFPREMSHLRNAYREAVDTSKSDKAPTPDVNFSLKDPESGEDSVPVFSKTQTPLSQNAVLGETINEIQRERIRIVDVVATNVLDLLFLGGVLRRQCPDTRLLIVFPDLLYVQAAQTEPLTGTLAISTYPLFFARKTWMGELGRSSLAHSDMNSEGVYNATLLLLAHSENDPQASADSITKRIADYGLEGSDHPPAWLMTLNRFGFSPVKVMPSTVEGWFESVPPCKDPQPVLPNPPYIWTMVLCLFVILSLAFTGWIAYLDSHPCEQRLSSLAIDGRSASDFPRLFCLFVCLLTLAAMPAILYIPLPFHHPENPRLFMQLLSCAGIAAPLYMAGVVLRRGLWTRSRPLAMRGTLFKTPRDFVMRRSAVILALAGFAAMLSIWAACCYGVDMQRFFFSFRTIELQAGASPAIPILSAMLVLFLFSAIHLIRFYYAMNQRPRVGTASFSPALKSRLIESLRSFNRCLLAPLNFRWREQMVWLLGGTATALAGGAFLRVHERLSSIDGWFYDSLSIGLQILVILTLLVTCWQLKVCWSSFRSFLVILNRLPLAGTSKMLTADARKGPIWVRRLNLQSLDVPIRSVTLLHDMTLVEQSQLDAVGVKRDEVKSWFEDYRVALRKVFEERMEWNAESRVRALKTRQQARTDTCQLRDVGAFLSDEICMRLVLPQWNVRPLAMAAAAASDTSPAGEAGGSPGERTVAAPAESGDDVYRLAKEFIALHFSTFAIYGVRQIQNLILFLSVGFALLMVAMNSYNFQAPQMIGRFLTVTFLAMSYITGTCMIQMERDPVLSRIAGSAEGELSKEFYFKMIAYGALPVLGILTSLFPSLSNFLFSWVMPTLEALR